MKFDDFKEGCPWLIDNGYCLAQSGDIVGRPCGYEKCAVWYWLKAIDTVECKQINTTKGKGVGP